MFSIEQSSQLEMSISLGKVFGGTLDQSAAKAAATVGRAAVQVLVGWLPVVGNTVNAVTAGGITEAIGWIVAQEFEKQICTGVILCL